MATEYPTTVRLETETDADLSVPLLLGSYALLWVTFTLSGVVAALLLAEFFGGLLGAGLLVTVGLGFVAAGPVAARRTMESILSYLE